jgi:hypothetical protein
MGFLGNLFKFSRKKKEKDPDNTRLLKLIDQYIVDSEYESYKKVVLELEEGNAYLLLPSDNDWGENFPDWAPSPTGLKMKLGTWVINGLKTTAAFTSEQVLFEWAQKPIKYVSLRSQAVLDLCEANGICRVVVDDRLRTMVVLEKNG